MSLIIALRLRQPEIPAANLHLVLMALFLGLGTGGALFASVARVSGTSGSGRSDWCC